MACPHVSGGLALAKSFKPSATPAELKDCLYSSATEIDSVNSAKYAGNLGAGLMDVEAVSDRFGTSGLPRIVLSLARDYIPPPPPQMLKCLGSPPSLAPTESFKPTLQPNPAPSAPTKRPTLQPTNMPNTCGVCTRTLKLVITTDQYPKESKYALGISTANPCFEAISGPNPAFSDERTYSVDVSDALCEGLAYTFTLIDTPYQDGICCGTCYFKCAVAALRN